MTHDQPVKTYLRGAVAGSFYLTSQSWDTNFLGNKDKQNVRCMMIYTNVLFPPAIRTAEIDRTFIRLLANNAHLLGQYPMYQ